MVFSQDFVEVEYVGGGGGTQMVQRRSKESKRKSSYAFGTLVPSIA